MNTSDVTHFKTFITVYGLPQSVSDDCNETNGDNSYNIT